MKRILYRVQKTTQSKRTSHGDGENAGRLQQEGSKVPQSNTLQRILHLLAKVICIQSQDKFGWQVDLPPTFENDKVVEIFQTKMAERLEDMKKAKKQSHQLS